MNHTPTVQAGSLSVALVFASVDVMVHVATATYLNFSHIAFLVFFVFVFEEYIEIRLSYGVSTLFFIFVVAVFFAYEMRGLLYSDFAETYVVGYTIFDTFAFRMSKRLINRATIVMHA